MGIYFTQLGLQMSSLFLLSIYERSTILSKSENEWQETCCQEQGNPIRQFSKIFPIISVLYLMLKIDILKDDQTLRN